MKSNIDLTEDRDFPERFISSGNPNEMALFKLLAIPWKLQPVTAEELNLRVRGDDLFPTGNKAQILAARSTSQACDVNHCDRCGKKYKVIPWKREKIFGLCKSCFLETSLNHQKELGKIPWSEESYHEGNVFRL